MIENMNKDNIEKIPTNIDDVSPLFHISVRIDWEPGSSVSIIVRNALAFGRRFCG